MVSGDCTTLSVSNPSSPGSELTIANVKIAATNARLRICESLRRRSVTASILPVRKC